jgi:hypothetical protein
MSSQYPDVVYMVVYPMRYTDIYRFVNGPFERLTHPQVRPDLPQEASYKQVQLNPREAVPQALKGDRISISPEAESKVPNLPQGAQTIGLAEQALPPGPYESLNRDLGRYFITPEPEPARLPLDGAEGSEGGSMQRAEVQNPANAKGAPVMEG